MAFKDLEAEVAELFGGLCVPVYEERAGLIRVGWWVRRRGRKERPPAPKKPKPARPILFARDKAGRIVRRRDTNKEHNKWRT